MDYLQLRELRHHGIKGQRWGVRRFQNKDGTLTSAGEKRYSTDGTSSETKSEKDASKKGLNKTQKVLIGIGAVGLTAAAAYGTTKFVKYRFDKNIKAGDSLQRIANETGGLFPEFYASKDKKDNKRYAALLPKHYKDSSGADQVFKKAIKLKENIKVASDRNAKKTYNELLKNGKLKGKYISYDQFNQHLVTRSDDAKLFYEKLKSKGYGAVGDINDRKISGYRAKNPLIFFGDSVNKVEISGTTKISHIQSVFDSELQQIMKENTREALTSLSITAGTIAYGKAWMNQIEKANQNGA